MRRIGTLGLAALACLTLIASPAQARYAGRDMNLYAYVGSRPVNAVDPSGLEPGQFDGYVEVVGSPGGSAEEFFVRREPIYDEAAPEDMATEVDKMLDRLGFSHTDIYSTTRGLLRGGLWGPPPKGHKLKVPTEMRLRKGPSAIRKETDKYLSDIRLIRSGKGYLMWGNEDETNRKPCCAATNDDIVKCIQSKPVPIIVDIGGLPLSGIAVNCNTDVAETVKGCCLRGYDTALMHIPWRWQIKQTLEAIHPFYDPYSDAIENGADESVQKSMNSY